MDISEKIISIRKAKGLTQQILAEKANLSLSTIKRIEKGKVTPRIHTLTVLSRILNTDLLSNNKRSEEGDHKILIILSSLILLFLPPLNILFLLKFRSRDKEIVNKLLIFQNSSLILFILLLFLVPSITYAITGQKIYGQLNSPLFLYIAFILFNIFAALFIEKRANRPKDTSKTP